jgi:hypothetical protein
VTTAALIKAEISANEDLRIGHPGIWAAVVAHGQLFAATAVDRPNWLRKMKSGQCYHNAFSVSIRYADLAYAEGFARRTPTGEWVHHAWNVDHDGNAIDVTWRKDPPGGAVEWRPPPPPAYFGVANIMPAEARECQLPEWRRAYRQGFFPSPHESGRFQWMCGARMTCCLDDIEDDAA